MPVCTGIPVSRKKFLTPGASLLPVAAEGNGLVARTSTHASWSDPTLSACCDESQLLLGITTNRWLTNRGIPAAQPSILCPEIRFRRMQCPDPTDIVAADGLMQRITSYRLPVLLSKKEYKHMPPEFPTNPDISELTDCVSLNVSQNIIHPHQLYRREHSRTCTLPCNTGGVIHADG